MVSGAWFNNSERRIYAIGGANILAPGAAPVALKSVEYYGATGAHYVNMYDTKNVWTPREVHESCAGLCGGLYTERENLCHGRP